MITLAATPALAATSAGPAPDGTRVTGTRVTGTGDGHPWHNLLVTDGHGWIEGAPGTDGNPWHG